MMRRLAYRMERQGTWDEKAYNEEQFYPSAGGKTASGVFCDALRDLNSKTFFRFMRRTQRCSTASARCRSTSWRPEKPQRMVDLHAFYYKNVTSGIWKWNGGEGSRLEAECSAIGARRPPGGTGAVCGGGVGARQV